MLFGPDLSNYQKQFSLAHAQTLVRFQVSFAFIGRQWRNDTASVQRQHLIDAGVKSENIGEYLISLGGAWPTLFPTTKWVAIDVEPGSEFTTEADIDNALNWIRSQMRDPLIYSSSWAWDALGLTDVVKYGEQHIPLWNAAYDLNPGNFKLARPFGGWTECAVDQYTDRWQDDPLAIPYPLDMNASKDDFWPSPAPPEPAPTPTPIADIKRQIIALAAQLPEDK